MRAYPLECDELVDDVLQGLDRVTEEVHALFDGLTPDALSWSPGPESWSVGRCLAHLERINALYRDRMEPALATARPRDRTHGGPLRGSWLGRWFTGAVGPDGRRTQTPALFQPAPGLDGAYALSSFFDEQRAVRDMVGRARGLDLDAIRVVSPASALLRFRASDAFRILVEHEKRHLAQADRVLAEPGFPSVTA